MKINYLKLNNIGPYIGEHYFDLNTNSFKNINLIGGKNGAGKTTFLKAIKYGMFGSFSLGFKTYTPTYLKEIKTLLNNKTKNGFFIEIGFEYVESFVTFNYVIRRNWKNVKGELIESIRIYQNGKLLDDYQTKEVNDKIHAITSPQLINSFIFDGEKIGNIIENEKISEYLEEIFNSIFSIDLIKQTQEDLNSYLSKKAEESKNKDALDNITLINKINALKNQIANVEKSINDSKKYENELKLKKKANLDSFYKLGGLSKTDQEKYNKKLDLYASERDVINKSIRKYVESILPFYMNFDLFEDAFTQIQLEYNRKYLTYVDELEIFLNIKLDSVRKSLLDVVNSGVTNIHNLSNKDYEVYERKLTEIVNETEKIKPLLKTKYVKYDEYRILKNGLNKNKDIAVFDDLISDNQRIDSSLENLNREIKELESNLQSLKNELKLSIDLYEKTNDAIKKDSLYDASFILGKEVYDICSKFEIELRKAKLSKVGEKALEIFCDTIRKKDFISQIKIHSDYTLELKNSSGIVVNPKTLSAGEMQILVSSIIWAMFRVSGRREMFIFDTPLARLDTDNRQNFISKIISTISSQVVILSTDSEFVGENYDLISNKIYKKYLLEYDESSGMTNVKEDYFGGE